MSRHPVSVLPPLPKHVQLEVTSACNLRCQMCLVRYRPAVNKADGAMSYETFLQIVDSNPRLERVTLQGLGEPLLSPHLLKMIAHLKSRGIAVGFNTNATLLRRRLSDQLVETGVDWVHVSLDAASKQTFEKIRDGASFVNVVHNLRDLAAAKREAGSSSPWIRVVFVVMRSNLDELPDLVEALASWGIDELRVQSLSHSFGDTDPAGSYAEIRDFVECEALWTLDAERVAKVFDDARTAAEEAGLKLRLPEPESVRPPRRPGHPGCTWPWDATYITSSGVVQPCCMVMGDDRISVGNVSAQSFAEVWEGAPYQEFREALLSDQPPEVCRGCSLYRGTF